MAGPLAAAAIALAATLFQLARHREVIQDFSRFRLPAFDPYVYVAMAEHPAFFTVAPWGYRILTPFAVHVLGFRSPARGYLVVTVLGLVAAGVLLYAYLRALGHARAPALAAVAVFGLSRPAGESVQSLFMAEPLAVAVEIGFLLALELGAALPVLSLLLCLMAFSKEIWVLLLPLVWLAVGRGGDRLAPAARILRTLAIAVPPLVVALALRWWWAPHIRPPRPVLDREQVEVAFAWLRVSWPETWPGLLLDGLTPLALLGLLHPAGRAFARRYGLLALALIALALGAWLYVPAAYAMPYYGANTTRLMMYALPLLLPLALFAVDRFWPAWRPPAPRARPVRAVAVAAMAGVAACMSFPFVGLDRYRRLPLHARRDGPLVLTIIRESLRSARRLDAGRAVARDLEGEAYRPGESDPGQMARMRWYLRDGWGEAPAYTAGPVTAMAAESTVLLPSFAPRDLALTIGAEVAAGAALEVLVNGRSIGAWREGTPLRVPAALLFRGDNLLTLRGAPGATRLRALSYAPAGPAAP